MPGNNDILLDSNILLRMSKHDDPHHSLVSKVLATLMNRNLRLCYTRRHLENFGTSPRALETRMDLD